MVYIADARKSFVCDSNLLTTLRIVGWIGNEITLYTLILIGCAFARITSPSRIDGNKPISNRKNYAEKEKKNLKITFRYATFPRPKPK